MTKNSSSERDAAITLDEATLGTSVVEAPVLRSYSFAAAEAVFRAHFEAHAATNCSYNDYRPVYRYGYDLGTDDRYRHAGWAAVEQAAQSPWEARNPGTWAQFHDIIQFAWETARVM